MRPDILSGFFILVASLLVSPFTFGQAFDPSTAIDVPSSISSGSNIEHVDTMSGALVIRIPLLHFKGRGVDFDLEATYSSKVWNSIYLPASDYFPLNVLTEQFGANSNLGNGWNLGVPSMMAGFTGSVACPPSSDPDNSCVEGSIFLGQLFLNSGQTISVTNITDNSPTSGQPWPAWSYDGTYAKSNQDQTIWYLQDGTRLSLGEIEDPNGNYITCSSSLIPSTPATPHGPISCIDTVGRQIDFTQSSIAGVSYSTYVTEVHYKDSNNQAQTISLTYQVKNLKYAWAQDWIPCNTPNNQSGGCINNGATAPLLTRITMADGSHYDFEYLDNGDGTSSGELTKLILPTGGYVRYTYTNLDPTYSDVIASNRRVSARYISPDGTSASEQYWNYGSNGCGPVLDPQGNTHIEEYSDFGYGGWESAYCSSGPNPYSGQNWPPVQGIPVPTMSEIKDAAGNIIQKITRTFEFNNASYYMTQNAGSLWGINNPTLTSIRESIGGSTNEKLTTYSHDLYGNITSESHYDWASQGGTGALLRTITKTFLADQNPSYAADSVHILDRVTSESISGVCSTYSGTCSQKTYTHDGYSTGRLALGLSGTSSVIQHDDKNFSSANVLRGNVTQEINGTGGAFGSETHDMAYDDLGNVIAVMDAKGNTTTYDYTDHFSGSQPSSPTRAYITTATLPATGSTVHVSHATYYYNSGSMAAFCGENFVGTCDTQLTSPQSDYRWWAYDLLNRPTRLTFGDGGYTALTYPNPNQATSSNATGVHVTSSYDGLGRHSSSIIDSISPGIETNTEYDNLGRVWRQYSPHFVGQSYSTDGVTEFTYDAIGRKLIEKNPDETAGVLSRKTWSYSGNATTATDERNISSTGFSDADGNLVQVNEPDPTGSGNLVTTYTYDALGNLVGVSQSGHSGETSRERSFFYDSLSRLTSSTNPETGTITYSYLNGTALCSGDASLPCSRTDARGITTTYAYDALNRVTSKIYSDGPTQAEYYAYDVAPGWMTDLKNIIGRVANINTSNGGDTSGRATAAAFSYDAMGRVVRKWEQTPSASPQGYLSYASYDLAGNLTDFTYSDGFQITNHYDSAGRLDSVKSGTALNPGNAYVSSITYSPSGAVASMIYGNGVTQALTQNSRLQPCKSTATLPSSLGGGTIYDRRYFYGSNNTTGQECDSVANNNGNIMHIVDAVNGDYSQDFAYDTLNRITQWSAPNMANAVRSQTYNYDSFGNLWQSQGYSSTTNNVGTPSARMFPNPLASWTPGSSSPYSAANQLANNFHDCLPSGTSGTPGQVNVYDTAGNLQCDGSSTDLNARQYLWDGANRIAQVNAQQNGTVYYKTADYVYNAEGQRARANRYDISANLQSWREYTYFGGQMMAEKDNTDAWTHYIYAGDKKIARIDPDGGNNSKTITVRFSDDSCSGCGSGTAPPGTDRNLGVQSITVNGVVYPSSGFSNNCGNYDATTGTSWLLCNGDISITTTEPLTSITVSAYGQEDTGTWPHMQLLVNGNLVDSHVVTGTATNYTVDPKVHYSVGDHLGTALLELSSAGNVTWKGEFAPFGQELSDPTSTTNRYKFTGKERDAESGLDYFGARYYNSNMGRFMSPDWSAKADPIPYAKLGNPQSLNLYGYVGNSPIGNRDIDGHYIGPSYYWPGGLPHGGLEGHTTPGTQSGTFTTASWSEATGDAYSSYLSSLAESSAQQQGGDKKQQSLSYKVLKTGKDEQQIRWQLSQKSKAGGIIVQEVSMFDAQGNLVHNYWEAWTVNKGGKGPGDASDYDYDDKFQAPMSGGRVEGTARFYEGVKLPDSFIPGLIPQAGTLPSTPRDPELPTATATAPVTRVFIQP